MTDDARKTLPWSSIINKDCGVRLQSYELEANVIEQNRTERVYKILQHKTNILKKKKKHCVLDEIQRLWSVLQSTMIKSDMYL